jgi:hypothetical protein
MIYKQITGEKELKVVMPSGKYMSVKAGIIAEVKEGERIDWTELWDDINQQLSIQAGQYDPSWIETQSLVGYDKITIKVPRKIEPTDVDKGEI